MFSSDKEAKSFMKEHNISSNDFNITIDDIHDKNFLLANKYYKYDYHIPYKNREFIEKNIPFSAFMKTFLLDKKQKALKKNSLKQKKKPSEKPKKKPNEKPEKKPNEKPKKKQSEKPEKKPSKKPKKKQSEKPEKMQKKKQEESWSKKPEKKMPKEKQKEKNI